jgi:hypothetical protein
MSVDTGNINGVGDPMSTVTVSEDIASKALSLAYSRMGQNDAQGEQARTVARALYDALDDRSSDYEQQH